MTDYYKNKSLVNLQAVVDGVLYIEEWKDVKGYECRYQVSSFGRVKSFVVRSEGVIRKGVPAWGYLQVQLKGNGDGSSETKKIHRMVAEQFIPNPENKPEVNHEFGIKTDNMVWVLKWATTSENALHAYRKLGKKNNLYMQIGETNHRAKYKNDDIFKIRELHKTGVDINEIAVMYNDIRNNIYRIVSKRRWAHI